MNPRIQLISDEPISHITMWREPYSDEEKIKRKAEDKMPGEKLFTSAVVPTDKVEKAVAYLKAQKYAFVEVEKRDDTHSTLTMQRLLIEGETKTMTHPNILISADQIRTLIRNELDKLATALQLPEPSKLAEKLTDELINPKSPKIQIG